MESGQGPIVIHANEHLATSDRGVIMTRKMVKTAIEAVTRGEGQLAAAAGRS